MRLDEADLLEFLRSRFFAPVLNGKQHVIGAELEMLPFVEATKMAAPLFAEGSPSTVTPLQALAVRGGWRETGSGPDAPSWTLPSGGHVSFEPGGQIEISSAPYESVSSLVDSLRKTASEIAAALEESGIVAISCGVDPYNDVSTVPLQLTRDRYIRMNDYFRSVGTSGQRMMRQTAALQISVERGPDPSARWRLLNLLAPIVVALFANSRKYAGRDTGHASYRSHLWRTLDDSRTGVPESYDDPAASYLDFALNAGAIWSGRESGPYLTFGEWMRAEKPGEEEWRTHLTTLFPEVRPREVFELRSADAIDPAAIAAPLVFVAGLVYHAPTSAAAVEVTADAGITLEDAGRYGLADRAINAAVSDLARLSVSGARALGADYICGRDMECAESFFAETLGRG